MENFDNIFKQAVGELHNVVSAEVKNYLEKLFLEVQSKPYNLANIRKILTELFEFLNTPNDKTEANCKAVSLFSRLGKNF